MNTDDNVVQLRRVTAFAMPLNQLDSYEGRKALARLIREWERKEKGNTYKLLAARANLGPHTVARIASETTVFPRMHTILAIMVALGFTAVRFE